jgi:LuxR family maltose regulon positive regulatory protein
MSPRSVRSPKVAPPFLQHVLPRPRLFARLDRLRDRPLIWVCGPAGCGKTALVGSYLAARGVPRLWYQVDASDRDPATFFYYLGLAARRVAPHYRTPLPPLTPEYFAGLATFAGRYFERLGGRLTPPAALVFDNLQEVDEAAGLLALLREGLARLPQGLTAFLVSRHDPPPVFARLLANREMAVIGWEELRLAPGESAKILRSRALKALPRARQIQLHQVAEGWAAGLILLLEWARRSEGEPLTLRQGRPEQLFDYFGNEIFRKIDPATQAVLLKTALLPQMTARAAEALTGEPATGSLLARLHRQNTFTERRQATEPVFQYHPLMREFLLARGNQVFPAEERVALRRRAAGLLAAEGEVEAAAVLLAEAEDWQGLSALILEQASGLLAHGRHGILRTWLGHLPGGVIAGDAWLQYWTGGALLPLDPAAARASFESAFETFKTHGDATGTLLAWAGAVDACFYGFADFAALDRWIGELDQLTRTLGVFPSSAIEVQVAAAMVMALAFRQPWRPDLEAWASRGLAIQAPDAAGAHAQIWWALGYHGIGMGNFDKAAVTLDHLRQFTQSPESPPLTRINAILVEATYYHLAGEHEAAVKAATEGLELARREGVHVLDHMLLGQAASSAQNLNDWRQARTWLEPMETWGSPRPPFDAAMYHHLKAREALIRGNPREALPHSERSVQAILASGAALQPTVILALKARVLHALGREAEAAECLAQTFANAAMTSSRLSQFCAQMLDAEMRLDRGEVTHGLDVLRRALRLGSEGGFLNTFVDVPSATARLCARALEAGIEVPYVQWLIRKRRLLLEDPPYHLDAWPWPLRVQTLGAFRLEREGQPVVFSRKAQRKPLLLLKVLIALGGAEVGEEPLSDLLWPEAEGDAAHSAFTTTLSRLRDLLGMEQAIRVQEGRVTLDARYCWVDAWAFERLLEKAEERLKASPAGHAPGTPPDLAALIGRTMGLYRGHFLAGEEPEAWSGTFREKLRSKSLRLIVHWGEFLESVGNWRDAVECYHRGLEVDELAESLYQRLMGCYRELGLRGEAIATYHRCRKALSSKLGVEPSPRTEALYRSLRSIAE